MGSSSKSVGDYSVGGLRIGSLEGKNLALLSKWWWRFRKERKSFCARLIAFVYSGNGGLDCGDPALKGGPWVNIIKIVGLLENKGVPFISSFHRKVGNGESISFWTDKWLGDFKLCDKFQRLYALELVKNCSVSSRSFFADKILNWEWSWRRNLRGRGEGEIRDVKS